MRNLTKLILSFALFAPLAVSAQLTNSQKSELYYKNYLVNSAADHGKAQWSNSGGTFGVDTSSQFQDSVNSFSFDPSATGQYVQQTVGAFVSLKGKTCLAQLDYLGFDSNMEFRVTDGTNDLVTPAILGAASGTPGHVRLVFPCKTSAGNMVWRLESLGNAAVGYFKGYLGEAPASVLVGQASDVGSLTYPNTTNCDWSVAPGVTPNVFANFPADTDCPVPTTTGLLTAPATKIPGFVIPNAQPGIYQVDATFLANFSSGNCFYRLSDGTNSSGTQPLGASAKPLHLIGRFVKPTASGDLSIQIQAADDSNITCYVDNNYVADATEFQVKRFPLSSDTIVGTASTFKISSYLAGRSAVTTTPTSLGQYRVRYKTTASSVALADASSYTLPTVADGMKIYGNVAYTAAGTASQPGVYDIYIGQGYEGKYKVDFYQNAGKAGPIDAKFFTTGSAESGAPTSYDPSTGVLTVDAAYAFSGSPARYLGAIPGSGNGTANLGYFDVTVGQNATIVGADATNTTASWSGYHDYTCSWGASGTTWTDFPTADATCAFGTRTSKNLTVTSYKDGSNNPLPGITFTPPGPRTYYVCASPKVDQGSDGAQVAVRMVDGSGTVIADIQKAGLGNNRITQSICGIYSTVGTSAVTLKLQQKAATSSTTIATNAPNASGTDSAIEWSIFDITQANTATGGNVYSGSGSTNMRLEGVRVETTCTTGSCSLTNPTPGITGITWSSTGVYNVSFAAGTFSVAPVCVGSDNEQSNRVVTAYGPTTSGVTVTTITASSNAYANGRFNLLCMGTK